VSLYAAYAENLDPRLMFIRAPHSPQRGTGWLKGWRLTFAGEHWEGALATVVECRTESGDADSVFVALYDLTPEDERALDEWEGLTVALYRKVRVRVETLDGTSLAWLYVLDDYEGGLPSARYLGRLA